MIPGLSSPTVPIPTTTRFCDLHACAFRSCPNPRPFDSLQYCALHKCRVPTCQDLIKTPAGNVAAMASLLSLAAAAAALGGGNSGGSTNMSSMPGCGSGSLEDILLLSATATGGGGGAGISASAGRGGVHHAHYCTRHSCQGDGGRCGEEVVAIPTPTPTPTPTSTTSYPYDKSEDDGPARGGGGRTRRRRRRDKPAAAAAAANNGATNNEGGGEAETKSRFCRLHKCIRHGCPAEGTYHRSNNSGGGMCNHHYYDNDKENHHQNRSGSYYRHRHHGRNRRDGPHPPPDGSGGFPPFGMMPGIGPMMMPPPGMGYPHFFPFPPGSSPMYYDSESNSGTSSEDESGSSHRRGPRVPPFPGMFY